MALKNISTIIFSCCSGNGLFILNKAALFTRAGERKNPEVNSGFFLSPALVNSYTVFYK